MLAFVLLRFKTLNYFVKSFIKNPSLRFLSFSQAVTPLPKRRNYRGGGMASTIPPPHVPFASGYSSLLDVPRPGVPVPFLHPPPLPSRFLFWCFAKLLFCLFLCFLSFFAVYADLLLVGFAALRPLLSFFRAPIVTSFHRALLCTRSTYTRSISFPVFLFACIQLYCFSFPCISFVICL
jgi:hypothetical protein